MQQPDLYEALLDLRDWLVDQIDGGAECVGRDATITTHLATVEKAAVAVGLVSVLRDLVQEWKAGRFEWRENRDSVLSLKVTQTTTGGAMFDAAVIALRKAGL